MDSITQAALGAAIGEVFLGKRLAYKGALVGSIVATIPDLDIILLPFFSDLERISIHRGYSHSILFCVISSFLIAYLLSNIKWTTGMTYRRLWLFSFLSLFTHILLDGFTTFGTQMFLPFADWRVSFDSINIIDPIYTLPLLMGTGWSLWRFEKEDAKRSFPNNIGLLVSSCYLVFTLANKQHIENVFAKNLQEQHIPYYHMLTVPVKVANMNWYGVAKDDTHLYMGQYSLIENNKISFDSFPINDYLLKDLNSQLVDRLIWSSKGFYTVAQNDGNIRFYNMQCDMQGIRTFGKFKAPTAFYYEVDVKEDGSYNLNVGMQKAD